MPRRRLGGSFAERMTPLIKGRLSTAALTVALSLASVSAADAATSFAGTYQAHDDTAWFAPNTCRLSQPVNGMEPGTDGRYPVLLWVTATGAEGEWTNNTLTKPYDQALAKAAIRAAADSGFVAAYPHYRGRQTNGVNGGIDLQTRCMFNRPAAFTSALDVVCARPKADCSRIVVAGHSQGGMIAMRAANHEPNVKAAWSLGVSYASIDPPFWVSAARGGQRVLADSNLKIVTGYDDLHGLVSWFNGASYGSLRTFTGLGCADGTAACLRRDGSGWLIVPHKRPPDGPTDGFADHCFMSVDGYACTEPMPVDQFWLTGSAAWTFPTGLSWLRSRT
jgi:predicted esterase